MKINPVQQFILSRSGSRPPLAVVSPKVRRSSTDLTLLDDTFELINSSGFMEEERERRPLYERN